MIVTTTQGQEDRSKLLTATQEKALCRRIQANPSHYYAQDHIVRVNIGLIRTIANKKQGNGVDVEDLVQEGCLALIKAAQQFNLSLNIRLSTYATWKISQAMQRCIENEGTLIRLPSYQHHKAHQLKMLEATIRATKQRSRTPQQRYNEHCTVSFPLIYLSTMMEL